MSGPAAGGARVVVVGAGIAGTAAALAAAAGGARVVVVSAAAAGASALATGALDRRPWPEVGDAGGLSPGGIAVLAALGAYAVGPARAALLTTAGIVRAADGRDAALLDVAALPAGRIGVVDCPRQGWRAADLAGSWSERCAPLAADVLRFADERKVPDVDLAARHDDDDRVGWLATRLREALGRAGGGWAGIVLPPMLGAAAARAPALSRAVGLACGEAMGLPGGPAGTRFEAARDRALETAGVERIVARVAGVEAYAAAWQVVEQGGGRHEASAVVIATGGLVGGGLAYVPAEATRATALPPAPRATVALTLRAPLALGCDGRPLDIPSSLFGAAPESIARPWVTHPLLERAGALEAEAPAGLFASGEVAADVPRTWLASLEDGVRAGEAAARHARRY